MRLKENFFEEDAIDFLEEQDNGPLYTLFYLKLCLKSLKNEGLLIRSVGDILLPYSYEKLAEMTKTPLDTVVVAMELLKKIGLVRVSESGALDVPQVRELIGSESANDNAQRQKRFRERKKLEQRNQQAEQLYQSVTESVTNSNGENNRVTLLDPLRNSNERESKRKSKSIEIDIDNIAQPAKKKTVVRHQYGEYKNVLLSDEELEKFKSEYADWQRFIEELSSWLAENGKSKKNYLAALRNWAKRDYNGKRNVHPISAIDVNPDDITI